MKKLVCLSIIYLVLISWVKMNMRTIVNPVTIVDTIPKSYLALGDSYTIGESVVDTERFPVKTVALLRKHSIDIGDPDIIATTGWTTKDLINALHDNPPKKTYSLVTLLIGVNNQYQGKSLDQYKTEFATLLNMAVSYSGDIKSHVFILSIPDYSLMPFARGKDTAKMIREIDAFNLANRAIANEAGVHYIDITPISRNAKNNPDLIADDGLHPSALQYEKWSELLASMMQLEFK